MKAQELRIGNLYYYKMEADKYTSCKEWELRLFSSVDFDHLLKFQDEHTTIRYR